MHSPRHARNNHRLQKTLSVSTAAVLLPVIGATGAHAEQVEQPPPASAEAASASEQSERATSRPVTSTPVEKEPAATEPASDEPAENRSAAADAAPKATPAEPAVATEEPAAPAQPSTAAQPAAPAQPRADEQALARAAVSADDTQQKPATAPADRSSGKASSTPKGDSGPKTGSAGQDRDDDAQGDDAQVSVTCSSTGEVTATSTKDISNLVLAYSDKPDVKIDGLSGKTVTVQADGNLDGVYVKSGDNGTDAGPGYGEYVACKTTSTPGGNADDGDGDGNGNGNGNGGNDGDTGQGDDVEITVTCTGTTVTVTSSKEISNIVFVDDEGNEVKREDFDGTTTTFDRGDLVKIFVKSGNNGTDEGPGFGEEFLLADCDVTPGDNTGGGSTGGENTDGDNTGGDETDGETPGGGNNGQAPGNNSGGTPDGEETEVLDNVVDRPAAPGQGQQPAGQGTAVLDNVVVRTPAPSTPAPFRASVAPRVQVSAVPSSVTPTTLPFTGAGTELIGLVALTSLVIGGGMVVAGRREQEV